MTINENSEESNNQTLAVREVIVHEEFHHNDLGVLVNDIAILILSGSFQETEYVRPAKLPSSNHNEYSGLVRVSGWGVTEEGPELSEHLRLADVPVVSNENCAVIYDTNICAGEEEGGHDTCQGDSGGPMVIKSSEETELILLGVTSWGFGNLLKIKIYYTINKFY